MAAQSAWKLRDIAALVEGTIVGEPEITITGVADVERAASGDLIFAESPRYYERARQSKASAILASEEAMREQDASKPTIVVASPRLAFVRVLEAIQDGQSAPEGIHETAVIAPDARLGRGARVGPQVTIDAG